MQTTLVNGTGKCTECSNLTSYQMWVGKMQFFFCDRCIQELYYKSHAFLYENNEYFRLKEMENKTKELLEKSK